MPAEIFDLLQTHGMLRREGLAVRGSSDANQWTSAYLSIQREPPFQGEFGAVDDQLIVVHRSGPARIRTFRGDTGRLRVVPPGGVHLYPGRESFRIGLLDTVETAHLYLRRTLLEDVAGDMIMGDPRLVYIPPRITHDDATLAGFSALFEAAIVQRDSGNALYSDQLAVGLAGYLVRRHSTARLRPASPRARQEAGAEEICARAIDFMQAHIDSKITLDQLVDAVGRSSSLINAAFRKFHGVSTHQYLMRLRLTRARKLIAETRARITDIALDCGFASQEHLARYFKRAYGITPRAVRGES